MNPQAERFYSLQAQGFVRVAAAAPRGRVADPAGNLEAHLALARQADARGCDLLVFPELGLSSYAIDDLHLQDALLDGVETAIEGLARASASLRPLLIVGAPLRRLGRLFNCAVAISRGRVLGVVPKGFLPNYREFYEKRWFASGRGVFGQTIDLGFCEAPFGVDLIFAAEDLADFVTHVEICEDLWSPLPPSTQGALAGATVLCNLSASNIVIGKAEERDRLCAVQSGRCLAAYVYAAAGPGESTTDVAWDGQGCVHELGRAMTRAERFVTEPHLVVCDVDLERIRQERLRNGTFNDAAETAGRPDQRFRRIAFAHRPDFANRGLLRPNPRFPFVPDDPSRLDQDCFEAFNIQVQGLTQRLKATGVATLILGVSGGLDSAHALLVACRAFDLLGLPREAIRAYTLPGFATSRATRANAWALMRAVGASAAEIDIRPAARRMLRDIGHASADGEPLYDVTFENVQAGLRTDYLFRLANHHGGLTLGTGDLSELALGWCTYGVGDQMSHYGVNAGVPKTLIQHLIRWVADRDLVGRPASRVLRRILETEISPELAPAGPDGKIQSTEDLIGPYALHDFALYYATRYGLRPSKIAFLAWSAWRDAEAGDWPPAYPAASRRAYDLAEIKRWLRVFLDRFYRTSQFKRSALPNGPKVTTGGALSPRGDWRAPSDASSRVWLDELEANTPD